MMARCHHDNLEFDSGFTIEVAREDYILEAGRKLEDFPCEKNPGHKGFIPFKDLTPGDIPGGNDEIFNKIKTLGSRVVRLKVVEDGEVEPTLGTGIVAKFDNVYCIFTNNHIVKDNEDVRNCIIWFHYDSYDRSNIITSRGEELVNTCPYRDLSFFTFDPVPDFIKQLDLVDICITQPTIVIKYKDGKVVRNCAHIEYNPQVMYTGTDLNDPLIDTMFIEFSDDSISDITSSYFKFQPIPSNIQDITNIKIHVDEDGGKSTEKTGDVVKFDDEYMVKISEFIVQDKVKKLVWNGKVLRDTQLHVYFQQFQSREFFSDEHGVDLELYLEKFPNYVWVFDCQLKTRERVNMVNFDGYMCCIGHPHTLIKMVTFGQYLGQSLKRIDKHGRHIEEPGEDCQCKEVDCLKYSCETCEGSSGSPVFMLYGMSNQYFERIQLIHFQGKRLENINCAWDSQ